MSNKLSRHQSVVNTQSNSNDSGDHWLRQFEETLVKTSVQPANKNLFEQINSIMNGNSSKYSSVQAKVDDMLERSGMTAYISGVKSSKEKDTKTKKIAQQTADNNAVEKKPDDDEKILVFKQKPSIKNTLRNIIEASRGNLPLPTIIDKLRSSHKSDIADDNDWEDDNLIRHISDQNLAAKCENPSNYDDFNDLGRPDNSSGDSDIDAANTDAFHALNTATM